MITYKNIELADIRKFWIFLNRLELSVQCRNLAARHLYEKNGFKVEGLRKKSMYVDGQYIDEYYMAKLMG